MFLAASPPRASGPPPERGAPAPRPAVKGRLNGGDARRFFFGIDPGDVAGATDPAAGSLVDQAADLRAVDRLVLQQGGRHGVEALAVLAQDPPAALLLLAQDP